MNGEGELVEMLARIFRAESGEVELGIGDDCAVLAPSHGSLVWTVDAQVDEVHFRREWLTYGDVGYRSFAAAASDVVAMGAAPVAALSALTLDSPMRDSDVEALALGQREASVEASAPILGGNLSRGATFSVTTTVLGRVVGARAVLRGGARPGDRLLVSGPLGLAHLGLLSFQNGVADDTSLEACVQAFRRPRVRYDAASVVARAHAAIDVSDGLALDLSRLAQAGGVCIVISEALLLRPGGNGLRDGAARLGREPLAAALFGGEDYVVAFAFPADAPIPDGYWAIGEVEEGEGVLLDDGHGRRAVAAHGHDHFADAPQRSRIDSTSR